MGGPGWRSDGTAGLAKAAACRSRMEFDEAATYNDLAVAEDYQRESH